MGRLYCIALFGLGLFQARGQTTLNLSEDLVRLGIASSNMVPNQPSLDARPLLEQGVVYANNHSFSTVIADPGSYYFLSLGAPDRHVNLVGVSNLTIDLQGSDLYFANPQEAAIGFRSGNDSVLQNFTIDYLQLPFTQLQITAVDLAHGQLQVTPAPGWQTPSALNGLLQSPTTTQSWLFIFRDGMPLVPSGPLPGTNVGKILVAQPFSDSTLTYDFNAQVGTTSPGDVAAFLGGIRPGDTAVLTVRGLTTPAAVEADIANSAAGGCNTCTFRNIRIYAASSIGFLLQGAQSSLLERVYLMPRPGTDRLVSSLADGISIFEPGPNNIERLCRSIRSLDDGFSSFTWLFGSVRSVLSSRMVQVQGDNLTAFGYGNGTIFSLPNGSDVAFESGDGTIVGSAVLVSQTAAAPVNGLPQILLTFDRDLPGNLTGSYIYSTDPSWRGGNLLFDRNTAQYQNGSAFGMSLWGLVNINMVGAYIHHPIWGGVAFEHNLAADSFIVPPVVNATLNNNVIDQTNNALIKDTPFNLGGVEAYAVASSGALMTATSPFQNIKVSNNFIAYPAQSAVWVGNTSGGSVTNNYFLNPNNNAAPQAAYPPSFSVPGYPAARD